MASLDFSTDKQNSGSAGSTEFECSDEPDGEPVESGDDKVGADTTIEKEWIPRSRYRRNKDRIKKTTFKCSV